MDCNGDEQSTVNFVCFDSKRPEVLFIAGSAYAVGTTENDDNQTLLLLLLFAVYHFSASLLISNTCYSDPGRVFIPSVRRSNDISYKKA